MSVLLLITLGMSACANSGSNPRLTAQPTQSATSGPNRTPTAAPPHGLVLPGQVTWKNGASSLLFGTNDAQEYDPNNLETQPVFQQDLKSAGVTLIRTFLQDPSTDSEIDQRVATIQQIGAQCLAVLPDINDRAFNEHAVSYIGDRCLMYDFGNEPDWNSISIDAYSKAWISEIPRLRSINPHALFFGPVVSYPHTRFLRDFLTQAKAANVLPDAITVHWYACYLNPEAQCLQQATLLYSNIEEVRASVRQVLGKDLPIGVDEWNFDPSFPPPAYGSSASFVSKFIPLIFSQLVKAQVAYACQYDAASFAGYGGLDMFDVKTNQPKPIYYEFAKQVAAYKPA
ncbi:MAG TPA: hypothetical protein VE338_00480 [Ktedonobacterales bacterium]|jgi:hypothetical protein|nr:hypothetical protein [Ktedonobacterales bacterium]